MINTVLLDLDQTLVDSKAISVYRAAGLWDVVKGEIPNLQLYPGVAELLACLQREQLRVGIVSQSPRDIYVEPVCARLGINAGAFVGYHDVDRRKPSHEPLFVATARLWRSDLGNRDTCLSFVHAYDKTPFNFYRALGIWADNVIAIGDTSNDIAAARRAKTISTGGLWGADHPDEIYLAQPDYVCATPGDVIALIEDLKLRKKNVPRGDHWANDAKRGYVARTAAWFPVNTAPEHRKRLTGTEECYHLRRRNKGTWSASLTNSYISAFKTPTAKATATAFKQAAVDRFASELTPFLAPNATCLFVPTSKIRGDPEYDPRFDLLRTALVARRPDLTMIEPIVPKASAAAAHASEDGDLRDPVHIMENFAWVENQWNSPPVLYVIDDVLTSGGHFKAAELFVRANAPKVGRIIGVCWALETD